MIDGRILPLQQKILHPIAKLLVRLGVRADQITIAGFLVGLIALPLIANEYYEWALVFILGNRLLDGLDGPVARLTQATDRGAFLDIALDFAFYAVIPLAFAFADSSANAPSCCRFTNGVYRHRFIVFGIFINGTKTKITVTNIS